MNIERIRPARRAIAEAALAVATAAAFVFAWVAPGLAQSTRRLASFALVLVFVVLWHEAIRSWKGARTFTAPTERR